MAQYEKLAGMALGVTGLDLGETEDAFLGYLADEGWEIPPESYDWEGEYIRGSIVDYGDHGCWVFLEELEKPRPKLARGFAATLDAPLDLRQVEVTEKYAGGEASYDIKRRAQKFEADGESSELDVHDDPRDDDGYGDLYETAGAVLGRMVHEDSWSPVGPAKPLQMYRPEPQDEDGLDPRLAEIADNLRSAGSCELIEMSGQQMLRFELPDGTRQMSRVTDEELQTLVETTGVEPG